MIKFLILFYILFTFSPKFVFTQTNPGAKHSALSYSDVADENDVFALFGNPSGLALTKKRQIGIFYSPYPFGLKELSTGHLVYMEPFSFGNIAIGAMKYGFDLYSENRFSLGWSHNISEIFVLGFSAFYHFVKIKRYGSSGTANVSVGGQIGLHENLLIGFSLHNPIRYSSDNIELPLYFNMGLAFIPMKNTSLFISLLKELQYPVSFRFGVEYPLIDFLDLRIGIQNKPNMFSTGFGINYSFVQIDYSVQSHIDLGLTHQADLIISLN